jgi:hypothetical protein
MMRSDVNSQRVLHYCVYIYWRYYFAIPYRLTLGLALNEGIQHLHWTEGVVILTLFIFLILMFQLVCFINYYQFDILRNMIYTVHMTITVDRFYVIYTLP